MEINWQEPPARSYDPELDALTAELKKHPGRWALVTNVPTVARSRKYRNRGMEVIARASVKGGFDIYMRAPET